MNDLPPNYAESVMIFGLSEDGTEEISLRLARFPEKGTATVWLHLATGDGAWSLADESFELSGDPVTAVRDDQVSSAAHAGKQVVTFSSTERNAEHMKGRIVATLVADATRHPVLASGEVPIALDLAYQSDSPGFRSATNRWEMTGRLRGSVTIDGKTMNIDLAGKWHEQTGARARFAPAFTYFNVQGPDVAILTIAFAKRTDGYVLKGHHMQGIQSFSIDPAGPDVRNFRLVLQDDSVIEGKARQVQTWSVPIEGKRRPGSAILVDTNLGPMMGTLNDWDPDPVTP